MFISKTVTKSEAEAVRSSVGKVTKGIKRKMEEKRTGLGRELEDMRQTEKKMKEKQEINRKTIKVKVEDEDERWKCCRQA